jgi:hypothetical protein
MILYRRTGFLYDQEELARHFGVRISPSMQAAFSEEMPILTAQNFDEGVATLSIASEVQMILDQAQIPSVVKVYEFESAALLESQIIATLALDGDVWCEFVDGPLGRPHELLLHDNLIESYNPDTKNVILIDPSGHKKNRYSMNFKELVTRVSGLYGRKTGIITVLSR